MQRNNLEVACKHIKYQGLISLCIIILLFVDLPITCYAIYKHSFRQDREIIGYEKIELLDYDLPKFGEFIPYRIDEILLYFVLPIGLPLACFIGIIYSVVQNNKVYNVLIINTDNDGLVLRISDNLKIIERLNNIMKSELVIVTYVESRYSTALYLNLLIENDEQSFVFLSKLPDVIDLKLPVQKVSVKPGDYYIVNDYKQLLEMDEFIKNNMLYD